MVEGGCVKEVKERKEKVGGKKYLRIVEALFLGKNVCGVCFNV